MEKRKSAMKKYLAICSMLALVSASQATILFQEDFSGYTGPYPQALGSTAQIGTWTKSTVGAIDVRVYDLLDGTTGPCLMYVDDSVTVNPSVIAETIAYTASPIRITYDFKMRRAHLDDQASAVFVRQSDNDNVAYIKMQDANTTTDWISFIATGTGNNTDARDVKDTWYTMVMELPAMPASGTFTYKWTIYDSTGTIISAYSIGTKSDQLSYSADAGAQLIDQLVFTAPGASDKTSMLIDNILIETIPPPSTIWLLR